MKKKNLLSLVIIFLSLSNCFSFNFKKLKLQDIQLQNNLNKPVQLVIKSYENCFHCLDQNTHQTITALNPHEKKQITSHNQLIGDIYSLDPSVSFFCERKMVDYNKLIYTIHITEKNQYKKNINSLFNFSELDFDNAMRIHNTNKLYQQCLNDQAPQDFTCLLANNPKPSTILSLLKNLYEKNRFSKISPSPTPKIPLIMHQVWFGVTGDIPIAYKKWQRQWRKCHQNWRIICWNDVMISNHFPEQLYNQDIYDQVKKHNIYVTMSDIARFELVEKFGGFYTDCDSEGFESCAPLHYTYDFYTSLERLYSWPLGGGMDAFGAKPHHPILQECLSLIKMRYKQALTSKQLKKTEILAKKYHVSPTAFKILYTDGTYLFMDAILNGINKNNNKDIVFPNIYFCHKLTNEVTPALESFGCHHVYSPSSKKTAHWVKQEKKPCLKQKY